MQELILALEVVDVDLLKIDAYISILTIRSSCDYHLSFLLTQAGRIKKSKRPPHQSVLTAFESGPPHPKQLLTYANGPKRSNFLFLFTAQNPQKSEDAGHFGTWNPRENCPETVRIVIKELEVAP